MAETGSRELTEARKSGGESKDVNMNSNSAELDSGKGKRRGGGGGGGRDLSALTTSAKHKQYLQLVPTTLSDEDEEHEYDSAASPTSPGFGSEAGDTVPLSSDPAERDQQISQWKEELEKIEGEIVMLRHVLGSKVRRANELKRNLGITPFKEFKHDLAMGLTQIKESNTYQKTSAVVKTASEKTTSAFSTVGAAVSRKLGDIKNSQAFKSMEEKVSTSYASVKTSRSIEGLKEKLVSGWSLAVVPALLNGGHCSFKNCSIPFSFCRCGSVFCCLLMMVFVVAVVC
ncbi:uncharacterized protein LOC143291195 isoform X3 [Babylonia areolata]|uniref:uncharacterized protein LOC143291195 isoform X3 n=1 Tax=Babylonia areolata TaxID=304850 RepID=UPI003FD5CC82